MDDSYRALLLRGQSRRLIVGLAVAWFSFGMVALALFLTTHRATDSYGLAGVVVAAFSVGSGALAPFRGRLLDRRGTHPWLLVLAGGYAAALLTLTVLAQSKAPVWTLVVCAALGGGSAPPLVASLRAVWPSVVEEALVRRAYALTSIVGDVCLVAAPALAALLFVAVWWLPLALSALAAITAAFVIARNEVHPPGREPAGTGTGRLLSRGFVLLMAVEMALGFALGLVEVAVPTAASIWGQTAYSGFLLAAFAFGSVLGGIWFGQRHWRSAAERRYLLAALGVGLSLLLSVAASGAMTLAPLLVVAGVFYGPATISLFEALDDLTVSRATEAFTWITTSAAIGTAAGSAAAGWAGTRIGLWAPFLLASATLSTAAVLGLTGSVLGAREDAKRARTALRQRA